jgi:pre-mRNA-splicing factor RBM22/SLT11
MAGVEGLTGASEPKNEISKLYVANNSEKFQSIGGASVTSNKEKAKEILEKLALVRGNKTPKSQVKRKESSLVPSHLDKIDVTKIVSKLPFNGSLNIPEDKDLKTLFIFGIDDSLPEYKITDFFEKFGKVKSFNCQHKAKCGFITFTRRVDAEAASKAIPTPVEGQSGVLVVESIPLRITWGKERAMGNTNAEKLKVGTIVTKFMKKLAKSGVKAIEAAPKKKEAATVKQSPDYEKVFRDYEF